jgi:hypothetical protein
MVTIMVNLKTFTDIWHAYPVLQALTAIVVAALWGWGGLQSIRKGKTSTGTSWIIISFAILAVATVGFVVDRAWLGAAISVLGLLAGVFVVAKYCNAVNGSTNSSKLS